MWLYIFIIILLLCLIFVYDYLSVSKGHHFFRVFVILFLSFLVGLRYRIGTDTISYMSIFENAPDIFHPNANLDPHFSATFNLLLCLFKTISSDFWVVQLAISIFVNSCFCFFVHKLKFDYLFFSTFLLYFLGIYYQINCESIREAIAIGFLFLALTFLPDKKWKNFYVLVMCGTLFHTGCALMLILPIMRNLKFNKYTYICFLFLAIISPYVDFFQYISVFYVFLSGNITELLQFYQTTNADKGITSLNVNFYIFNCILPILATLYIRKKNKTIASFEFIVVLYVAVKILSKVIFIVYRYANYFEFIVYIYYSISLYYIVKGNFRKMWLNSYSTYLIFFTVQIYICYNLWKAPITSNNNIPRFVLINPYSSIFDKKIYSDREYLYSFYNK